MYKRRRWDRWIASAAASCAAVGCNVVDPASAPSGPDFAFEEDADPATAALPFVANELLVQPYPGTDAASLSALYAEAGATVADDLPEIDTTVLRVGADQLHAVAAKLDASRQIETIQKNYILRASAAPDDPMYARQPHLSQIDAPAAWDITRGDESIIIGIVDTGVEPTHPDIADKIIDGWNSFDESDDFSDGVGHGTQVAGVAAAIANNATGVAGLAWDNPIVVVRATDDNGETNSRFVAAGILWAANRGASVINVSFAPLWSNRVVRAAARAAFHRGTLVVISAGNGGGSTSDTGYAEALFVGAVTESNALASFSDRGPFVDLSAPGTAIRSTTVGAGYNLSNGTSFAAPIVTGVAALIRSVNPDLRPASVIRAMTDTATDLGDDGKDASFGHGGIDAGAAVAEASRMVEAEDLTTPNLEIRLPAEGDTLSGWALARVDATDADSGVADVVLAIDGIAYATDARAPYWFAVDTARFSAGVHELAFVATDHAGNASDPARVTVVFGVEVAPAGASGEIDFRSPADGAAVSGTVTIEATVGDADGLEFVEWSVDGTPVFTATLIGSSSGISYAWRTAGASPGLHTIAVTVTDTGGRQTVGQLALRVE